eukprot:NODE_417_length_7834_cov_0.489334.p7 type:complete len:129 gc:universal NODE_417_length_7834_cov_0.489334:6708-6322(-)
MERLVHLLAHHPDFSIKKNELKVFESYFEFAFESIASKDNISGLILACQQMKTVDDLITFDSAPKDAIYFIADLGIQTLTRLGKKHKFSMSPCTLKMPLPRGIVRRLPSEEATKNLAKTYSPAIKKSK